MLSHEKKNIWAKTSRSYHTKKPLIKKKLIYNLIFVYIGSYMFRKVGNYILRIEFIVRIFKAL